MIAPCEVARPRGQHDANADGGPRLTVCERAEQRKAAVRDRQLGVFEALQLPEFTCAPTREPPLLSLGGGPVAPSKSPPLPGSPPVQRENGAVLSDQVRPPLNEAASMTPCAPPFDQRSCCQAPTKWETQDT